MISIVPTYLWFLGNSRPNIATQTIHETNVMVIQLQIEYVV